MLETMMSPGDVHIGVRPVEPTKEAAIKAVSGLCLDSGASFEELCDAFNKREEEGSTGCGGGIAIPHAKIAGEVTPKVVVVRFAEPIEWEAIDDEPVNVAVCLVMPMVDEGNTHLAVVSRFARKLASRDFIEKLKTIPSEQELYTYLIENVED